MFYSCEDNQYGGGTHLSTIGWVIIVGLIVGFILLIVLFPITPEEAAEIKKSIEEKNIKSSTILKKFEKLEYKGGHPGFAKPCTVDLEIEKDGIRLRSLNFMDSRASVKIDKTDIVHISFEEKGSRSVGKTAVGAVVGGVLTGGLGLIAGGALGAMKKNVSNLHITINHHNREYEVIIKAGKKAAEIYGAIANIL